MKVQSMFAKSMVLVSLFLMGLVALPGLASADPVCVHGTNPDVCEVYSDVNTTCAAGACVALPDPIGSEACVTKGTLIHACVEVCFLPIFDNGVSCAEQNAAGVEATAAPYLATVNGVVVLVTGIAIGQVQFVECGVLGGPFCPGPV